LGEHGEEASQKITELEALCKKKEDAAKKPKEEKANLEGMIHLMMGWSWRWLTSMDSTAWVRLTKMKMTMRMKTTVMRRMMMDDLDDLDDPTEVDYDVDEWFPEGGSNDRDWVIKSRF
jgi:hypothetical protein